MPIEMIVLMMLVVLMPICCTMARMMPAAATDDAERPAPGLEGPEGPGERQAQARVGQHRQTEERACATEDGRAEAKDHESGEQAEHAAEPGQDAQDGDAGRSR